MKAKVLLAGAGLLALAVVLTRLEGERVDLPSSGVTPRESILTQPADLSAASSDSGVQNPPALASYRVIQDPPVDETLPYRGANYSATVSKEGLQFEAGDHRLSLRSRLIRQGDAAFELTGTKPVQSRFAAAAIDHGQGISEEFIFENRRAEHLVRIARPLGDGPLALRISVKTSLEGPVHQVRRGDAAWKDTSVEDGGLVFTDAHGKPGLSYHGAVAIDAAGRKAFLEIGWENEEIALAVPESFTNQAAYPIVIDPWLELDFSATGGGLSNSGTVSETPALATFLGTTPMVAWSDSSNGNFEIYFRYWNGFEWKALANSMSPGGVSQTEGKSSNPTIGFFNIFIDPKMFGHPYLAWEDDTSGTINIYAKFWDGTAWIERAGSATGSGVSLIIGPPCRHPQALGVDGFIANTGIGAAARTEILACIVYEVEGLGLQCRYFYPGDDRADSPPPEWYTHPAGAVVGGAAANFSATRPAAKVDFLNRVVVAWEQATGPDYDIFVTRPGETTYRRLSVAAVTFTPQTVDLLNAPGASAAWGPVGTPSNITGGLPDALSIQPALAIDGANVVWVAWQETVGLEREIYVRNSSVAAWTGVAGSSTAGGVSATTLAGALTTSSFPSIDIDSLGRAVVAWEEDVSGIHQIYVRRVNSVLTSWEQIGDEGSALMDPTRVPPDTTGQPGGVSRTPSFSLRPKVATSSDGSITVIWRDGSGSTFDLFLRRFHFNHAIPSSLLQQAVSSTGTLTPISQGGATSSNLIQFSATLEAESASAPTFVRMQLEVRPSDSLFTGMPTHESLEVPATTAAPPASLQGVATILFSGLVNTSYHWRVRTIDASGRGSPWRSFGNNADGAADFTISSSAVGASTGGTKSRCGLLGVELIAALAAVALLRRRRIA